MIIRWPGRARILNHGLVCTSFQWQLGVFDPTHSVAILAPFDSKPDMQQLLILIVLKVCQQNLLVRYCNVVDIFSSVVAPSGKAW